MDIRNDDVDVDKIIQLYMHTMDVYCTQLHMCHMAHGHATYGLMVTVTLRTLTL